LEKRPRGFWEKKNGPAGGARGLAKNRPREDEGEGNEGRGIETGAGVPYVREGGGPQGGRVRFRAADWGGARPGLQGAGSVWGVGLRSGGQTLVRGRWLRPILPAVWQGTVFRGCKIQRPQGGGAGRFSFPGQAIVCSVPGVVPKPAGKGPNRAIPLFRPFGGIHRHARIGAGWAVARGGAPWGPDSPLMGGARAKKR